MHLKKSVNTGFIRISIEKLIQILVILAIVFGITTLVILFASPGGVIFPLAVGAALSLGDFPSIDNETKEEK